MALFSFAAGTGGEWAIDRIVPVLGEPLPPADKLAVAPGDVQGSVWRLRGVRSNERYTTRAEKDRLSALSPPLGRPGMGAALIPIRKSQAWWDLAQDERRAVLERSRHIATGIEYLPAVARRLYHSRDLGEPFDFLTWFEFAPEDEAAFDELVRRMRATEEWRFVDREVEVRLSMR